MKGMTFVRTHTFVSFANPYLRCRACEEWIDGWHDPVKCGCESSTFNHPCRCLSEVENVCPSWSPVDGCTCGRGAHDEPPVSGVPGQVW